MQRTTNRKRRGRPRKVESYADWMARIDAEVTDAAAAMEHQPPTYDQLSPEQRRIVQMLIEHMRSLPTIGPDENEFSKPAYTYMNGILLELFLARYPSWTRRPGEKKYLTDDLPNGEGAFLSRLLRNCAGYAPPRRTADEYDDE